MKSVFLVGGSGFLGLHLIEQFWQVSPRPKIHVFDIRELPTVEKGNIYTFDPKEITVHVGDLTSEDDLLKALKVAKPDVVVHSASPIHGLGPEIYRKVNITGTRTLIKCCKQTGVGCLVYTSSAGVVFNGDDLYGVDETCRFPTHDMDEYNATKRLGERIVLKANDSELRTIALRPAGIFGPGDRQMIPQLRLMAKRGQHRFQLGNNLNLFDVTYVGNVAWSHVLAAEKLLNSPEPVAGQAFFITNDAPIYFWSLAKQIWKNDGYTIPKQIVIPQPVGVALGYLSQWGCALVGKEPSLTAFRVRTSCATRYYDITKAKSLLDYKPKWSLEEAISLTLKYA